MFKPKFAPWQFSGFIVLLDTLHIATWCDANDYIEATAPTLQVPKYVMNYSTIVVAMWVINPF